MTEDDYCRMFADALADEVGFRQWVLGQTKFANRSSATLVLDELSARPAKAWWRHWWTRLPDGSESETDVFAVFHDSADGLRFALHVECKIGTGRFQVNQPAQYAVRGEFMKTNKWVPYDDFDTLLLAPQSFGHKHPTEAAAFGSFVSFEQIADLLEGFRG